MNAVRKTVRKTMMSRGGLDMVQDAGGVVVKRCQMCGKRLEIADWYAAMSRKYCPACSDAHKRLLNADRMRRARLEARERRKLEQEQTRLTMRENDLLREALRQQAARIEYLEGRLKK